MGRADVKIPVVGVDKFSKTFDKAIGGLSRIDKTSAGLARGFGVLATAAAAGAVAVFAIGRQAIDSADKLGKLSDRLGASTEALSQYGHVAKLSGVRSETLVMGWQRMTRRVSEAAQGYGEAKGALKELNLEADQLSRLAPEDQFEQIAEALSQVAGRGDRVRLAMKLFDSEGVSLLQMMKGGAAGLREMRVEADSLGLTLSGDMAASAADAKDAITKMDAAVGGVKLQLAGLLAPEVVKGVDWLSDRFDEMRKGLDGWNFNTEVTEKIKELQELGMDDPFVEGWGPFSHVNLDRLREYAELIVLAEKRTNSFAEKTTPSAKVFDPSGSSYLKDQSFPEEWEHENLMQASADVEELVGWWASLTPALVQIDETAIGVGIRLNEVASVADEVGGVIGDASEAGANRLAGSIASAVAQGKIELLDLGSIAESVFSSIFAGFLQMGISALFNPAAALTGVVGVGPMTFGVPGLPVPNKAGAATVAGGGKGSFSIEQLNVNLTGGFNDDPIEVRKNALILYEELQVVARLHGPED